MKDETKRKKEYAVRGDSNLYSIELFAQNNRDLSIEMTS